MVKLVFVTDCKKIDFVSIIIFLINYITIQLVKVLRIMEQFEKFFNDTIKEYDIVKEYDIRDDSNRQYYLYKYSGINTYVFYTTTLYDNTNPLSDEILQYEWYDYSEIWHDESEWACNTNCCRKLTNLAQKITLVGSYFVKYEIQMDFIRDKYIYDNNLKNVYTSYNLYEDNFDELKHKNNILYTIQNEYF